MRKAVWLVIAVGVMIAGVLATPSLSPDARARAARFARCADNLSAACLADLGAEMGLAREPPPPGSDGIRTLQLLGRDGSALALVKRSLDLDKAPDIAALGGPEGYLAPVRIALLIDQGLTPADAYARTPGARYLHMTHALHLLREPPFGTGQHTDPLTKRQRAQFEQTAAFLEALAESLQPGWKKNALEMAMELYLKLDEPASVRRLFDRIDWGDDWQGILPEGIIAVVGMDHALSKCPTKPDCRIALYKRVALTVDSPTAAERMLRLVFAHYRDREPWPEFDKMEEVVGIALKRGDTLLARALAHELDELAQVRKDVFPSFRHIAAARALLISGAPWDEVRVALDRAEAEMPGSDAAVIGLGHMGPISWGGGIGAQALREQASLRAQIGEVDRAILLMEGIEDPAFAWGDVLGPELPVEMLDQLLPAAAGALGIVDLHHLRAQTAAEMFWWDSSPAHHDWALGTARDVMEAVDPGEDKVVATCLAIARIAQGAHDEALRQAALTCAGEGAIHSRDSTQLLQAATLWFTYETTSP